MKRSILVLLALWGILGIHSSVQAQNLVIGSRVSELKTSEYLHGTLQKDRPMLIEFFYSASEPCRDRLPELNKLAGDYAGKIDVLVLANEDRDRIIPLLKGENYAFAVALDDAGKTFNAYGVRFVPFSVLLDAKGRVLWFGHSARLTIVDLEQAL
jgi:thiol-disulfide isomerase/thioredoxin